MPLILYGSLQLWFQFLRRKEAAESMQLVEQLRSNNTDKLSKQEQFEWLDGSSNWERLRSITGRQELPLYVLDYFIEVTPDEYLEHLRTHNPPKSWMEDTYGEVQLTRSPTGHEITRYSHGKRIWSKSFTSYDQVLKYLVYERLMNVGGKYKYQLKKSYYT
ncbi:MAG: hypothetical protein KF905_05485 [Flavobacteriales bacterium]|nr:hypothetical protein [Flavobacteriales bacterium]